MSSDGWEVEEDHLEKLDMLCQTFSCTRLSEQNFLLCIWMVERRFCWLSSQTWMKLKHPLIGHCNELIWFRLPGSSGREHIKNIQESNLEEENPLENRTLSIAV